ncbi:hypothetical protein [Desulfosporosinus hippei]|uniref:Uncharacterized protein n=1 Tax=Desulfosporosinus hippei DSM 8344 TaxID=1121419 RepID=A0A1G8HS18_9FIRM|nr:hypothetical protein [Desulfosporosinus hippei]SDI09467.1 hypothetical protein SAMN05443529_12645 [Desulfosporosinus hippei DSM 8344]
MSDLVISDERTCVKPCPKPCPKPCSNDGISMLIGAFIAGIGLFLIGSPTSGAVTTIVGFILFLIGVILFTL